MAISPTGLVVAELLKQRPVHGLTVDLSEQGRGRKSAHLPSEVTKDMAEVGSPIQGEIKLGDRVPRALPPATMVEAFGLGYHG